MSFNELSMNEHARRFLSQGNVDCSLPKELNVALQNIFTKVRDNDTPDKNRFRQRVILVEKFGDSPAKYTVKNEAKHSIYNALCLLYLMGTGETKKLFQHYEATRLTPEKRKFSSLTKKTDEQFLAFFCLGVVRENIDKILACLCSTEFDLFTDKLPSPFSSSDKNKYDLSPMLKLYGQVIPWQEYMPQYEKAEVLFLKKEYTQAKEILLTLEQEALIRLPVVNVLNKKIKAEEAEAIEAFDYFQKTLN